MEANRRFMRHNREKDYFTAAAGFSEALWEGAHFFQRKAQESLRNELLKEWSSYMQKDF